MFFPLFTNFTVQMLGNRRPLWWMHVVAGKGCIQGVWVYSVLSLEGLGNGATFGRNVQLQGRFSCKKAIYLPFLLLLFRINVFLFVFFLAFSNITTVNISGRSFFLGS